MNKDLLYKLIGMAIVLAIFVGFSVLGGFIGVFVLNTLFPVLAIPYSIYSYLAFALLMVIVRSITSKN